MRTKYSIISSHGIRIGIVIALLLISSLVTFRLDLSRERAFSLSKISKDLVRNLDDVLLVKILSSNELPADLISLERYTKDLLAEYQSAGGNKFRFEHIQTASHEELLGMAYGSGLGPMKFRIYENDQVTAKEVIFGLIFEYQGRVESLNLSPRIEPRLEYEMTMRIQSLVSKDLPIVAVFRDTTYYHFDTSIFERGLRSNFTVVDADLSRPVQNVDALLFTGSSRNLPDLWLYNLDQYLMKGGSVIFLQDNVDTDGSYLNNIQNNVIKMLEHYGFQLTDDVVLDMNCDKRQMGIGRMASYPMYPVMNGSDHPISKDMEDIVLYLASGITALEKADLKYEVILRSSENSGWMISPEFQLSQELFYNPELEDFSAGPIVTAALATGKMDSWFRDSDLARHDPDFTSESKQGKLILFADKELVINPDNPIFRDRANVIYNSLDYFCGRESMIRIRNRHLNKSVINIYSFIKDRGIVWGDQNKTVYTIKLICKVISIALAPLILILAGLWMALRRKLRLRHLNEKV
ncbi:MAG: GldG family protein [Candidatus Cloacimonetes bacterium]|jgi:gliding-associated putative ABC transporter substrate-binding component GldG|nr:GldG family protein [Candidatus Cloacimonadota bacterium]MDD2506173.1 GldG family protein [Candidatus Cloacimonadota bacterium]MDD4559343.1 GldG family protein [Candidatus Cloacimonadota bacterium]